MVDDDGTLMRFGSHISGKNADVAIYPDRIEWHKGRGISASKLAAATFTGCTSLAATGFRSGQAGSAMSS